MRSSGFSGQPGRFGILAAFLAAILLAGSSSRIAAQSPSAASSAGEVHVGDRILLLLSVAGDTARRDTVTVREGKTIVLPILPDVEISLQGIRRTELAGFLTRELAKYVREPRVQAKTLLRLQVSGPVGQPGFYQVESDRLLSDVVMMAGGPSGNADLNRTVIRRQGEQIMSVETVRGHMIAGTTLDRLDLRPGDEIAVGAQRQRNLLNILQVSAAIASTALAIYFLANRI